MELLHACLNVADADETIAFYEQFGFEESWSFESGDTENRYIADDDGVELQLADTDGEASFEQGTAWDHLAVRVEDVDATFEAVENHGVVEEPSDQPAAGARTAFIEDPDGRVLELIEPLD
ncbi:lactoylglutathione lyase [Halobacteriales archaeon QH_7_65_31]|nr:MAG: lactoylglutathione lyase [Halobacteriales archaeon QH_7_65_31]